MHYQAKYGAWWRCFYKSLQNRSNVITQRNYINKVNKPLCEADRVTENISAEVYLREKSHSGIPQDQSQHALNSSIPAPWWLKLLNKVNMKSCDLSLVNTVCKEVKVKANGRMAAFFNPLFLDWSVSTDVNSCRSIPLTGDL